jgi:hypothetical protein
MPDSSVKMAIHVQQQLSNAPGYTGKPPLRGNAKSGTGNFPPASGVKDLTLYMMSGTANTGDRWQA